MYRCTQWSSQWDCWIWLISSEMDVWGKKRLDNRYHLKCWNCYLPVQEPMHWADVCIYKRDPATFQQRPVHVLTFSQIHRFLYSILKNMYCLGLLYDFPLIYLAKFQFKLYYFPFWVIPHVSLVLFLLPFLISSLKMLSVWAFPFLYFCIFRLSSLILSL